MSRHGFANIASVIIALRPTLSELELRIHGSDQAARETTAKLLRALPHLQHLALYDVQLDAQDVVDPVPFHLRTLTLEIRAWVHINDYMFPFLTSSSATTLVSLDVPTCPRSPSGNPGSHNLTTFLSLTSLNLSLRVGADEPPARLLTALSHQLDTLPPSVRHLSLQHRPHYHSPSSLADTNILSHIPSSAHRVDVHDLDLGASYVAEFFERAPALEWRVFRWQSSGEEEESGVVVVRQLCGARGIELR